MSDMNEVEKWIQESPLPKEKKDLLLQLLSTSEGNNELFYKRLNEILIEDYNGRVDVYDKNYIKYEEQCISLDKKLEEKEEDLRQQLEVKIEVIDPNNQQEKDWLFESYHKEVKRVREEYENTLKEMSMKIIRDVL